VKTLASKKIATSVAKIERATIPSKIPLVLSFFIFLIFHSPGERRRRLRRSGAANNNSRKSVTPGKDAKSVYK